jgi:hypothetical protein
LKHRGNTLRGTLAIIARWIAALRRPYEPWLRLEV